MGQVTSPGAPGRAECVARVDNALGADARGGEIFEYGRRFST